MQFQEQPANQKPPNAQSKVPSVLDFSFLDDPAFRAKVNARVEMLMVQSLGNSPISMKSVDTEQGAKILAFYALRKHDIEIKDPSRFVGRHDIGGAPVWEALDPLFSNQEAILASGILLKQLKENAKIWPKADPILFMPRDALDNETFVRKLLEIDGFNWIYLSPRLKQSPELALLAIEHSSSVFEFIVRDDDAPKISVEMANKALAQNGFLLSCVPSGLLTDELVTVAVNNGGGSRIAYAVRFLGDAVWDDYERTLKAIEDWPPVIKLAPNKYLNDLRCRQILLSKVRERVMVVSDLPEEIQCDPEFVNVIVELLPTRPNLYGWLCPKAKENTRIKNKHEELKGSLE